MGRLGSGGGVAVAVEVAVGVSYLRDSVDSSIAVVVNNSSERAEGVVVMAMVVQAGGCVPGGEVR